MVCDSIFVVTECDNSDNHGKITVQYSYGHNCKSQRKVYEWMDVIWSYMGGCGKRLHSDGLHNLYVSLNISTVIKWRRTGWTGHAARMGEIRNVYIIMKFSQAISRVK
jgi:hypothetical protein